jgi:hypothetical protein
MLGRRITSNYSTRTMTDDSLSLARATTSENKNNINLN